MSSLPEIQQIPARHGTATFVPKGHVIKIINTYGRQVVDTWAFALPKPPSQEEMDEEHEQEEEAKRAGEEAEKADGDQNTENDAEETDGKKGEEAQPREEQAEASTGAEESKGGGDEAEDPTKGEDKNDGEKNGAEESAQKVAGSETETDGEKAKGVAQDEQKTTPAKAGWISYIPSVPSMPSIRSRGKPTSGNAAEPQQKQEQKQEKKSPAKTGEKRTWASYIPSGKGYSNYIPSNKSLSAFAGSHYRDPTKSYAEQLYDFSTTPVGAGALSAATGSGYAGSAYAAYAAFSKQRASSTKTPPMEYLSMPHCHTATSHLIPCVNDTLVSNLRKPLFKVIEDTAATHDTLIAACDPQRYHDLGVEKWEEHGSCAENLVLALKELNEKAGLKGNKTIGTDVTVNTVPAPLNLFMNVPWTEDGTTSIERPKGKKGEFIRLKAERDVVVVMSACPMDITPTNGGKCMAAHFLVQEPEKKTPAKRPAAKKTASTAKKVPQAGNATPQKAAAAKPAATPAQSPTKPPTKPPAKSPAGGPVKRPSENKVPTTSAARKPSQPTVTATNGATPRKGSTAQAAQPAPKPGRAKPKKLEKRAPSEISSVSGAKA